MHGVRGPLWWSGLMIGSPPLAPDSGKKVKKVKNSVKGIVSG